MKEENKKCCGNCEHHTPPWKNGLLCGWSCGNEESENYGLVTEYDDCCIDYEECE